MASLRPTLHNLRSTMAVTARKPSYAAGFRAAIATIVPLVLATAFGSTAGTWLSLGGGRAPQPMQPFPQRSSEERRSSPLLFARLERIARQLSTLHDAIERWVAPV